MRNSGPLATSLGEVEAAGTFGTFADVVRRRRSIRRFLPLDVAESTVEELLDLARQAPSSMNGQPWHFVVIRDERIKRELARVKNEHCPPEKRAFPADFLVGAPVVIAVCVDRALSHDRDAENAVLATAILLLAAENRGLGSVYLSARQPASPALAAAIHDLLGLPEGVEPFTLVPIGYPAGAPEAKPLRSLAGRIHHERYGRVSRGD